MSYLFETFLFPLAPFARPRPTLSAAAFYHNFPPRFTSERSSSYFISTFSVVHSFGMTLSLSRIYMQTNRTRLFSLRLFRAEQLLCASALHLPVSEHSEHWYTLYYLLGFEQKPMAAAQNPILTYRKQKKKRKIRQKSLSHPSSGEGKSERRNPRDEVRTRTHARARGDIN